MYLSKKNYIGANYSHREVSGTIHLIKKGVPISIKTNRVSYIIEEVAYWRKANFIHQWFVDNCQDGEDDCRSAYVSLDSLKELLETCNKVKLNPSVAGDILPTTSGFFFGSTEYDEYYMGQINYTIQVIETILDELGGEDPYDVSFEYSSSW